LIVEFLTEKISIIRNITIGAYSDVTGEYVEGQKEEIVLDAVVTPVNGKELLILPEAQRTSEMIKVFTDDRLYTANEYISKIADVIIWRDEMYQVQKVEDWTRTDLPHFKSFAAKVESLQNRRKAP